MKGAERARMLQRRPSRARRTHRRPSRGAAAGPEANARRRRPGARTVLALAGLAAAAVLLAADPAARALAADPGGRALAADPGGRALAEVPAPPSGRTVEVLRLDCRNEVGRREVTLFGNGTVRLRDGLLGKEAMGLAELGPDELADLLRRLAAESVSADDRPPRGVSGEWVERCDLVLELPASKVQVIHFGRYDTLPLGLSHVVQIAQALGDRVKELEGADRLPVGYVARTGDVLKRANGNLYRVVRYTDDKKAVELEGIDQPFELFVPIAEMPNEFKVLVSREK
jgi:hypothetical protein